MKRPTPSGLYAIADLGFLAKHGASAPGAVVGIVESLLRGGAKTLQLRAKWAPAGELVELARALRRVTRAHDATFIVNDRIDVALLCEADGVHLGQTDLPVHVARAQLGESALIGLSTHDAAQVADAQRSGADYLGYGPIFPTSSKESPAPVQGTALLAAAARASALPLTAIGGVSLQSVAALRAAGAAAFAVISELYREDEEPEARARAFVAQWRASGG